MLVLLAAMAIILTVIILAALFYGGYLLSSWAHKPWYPKRLYAGLGLAVGLGIAITAIVGMMGKGI